MFFCFYCERTLNDRRATKRGDRNKGLDHTTDHKTPLARGGPDKRSNKVPCCFRCNNLKGDLTAHEFRRFVAAYGYERQPRHIMEMMKYERVTIVPGSIQTGFGGQESGLPGLGKRRSSSAL